MTKTSTLKLNKVFANFRKPKLKPKMYNLAALGLPARLVDEDLFLWFQRINDQQSAIVKLASNEAMANGEFGDAVKIITKDQD